MHGGGSTGPRTPEGLERARKASLTHGRRSGSSIAMQQEVRASYRALRDMVREANAQARAEALLRRFGSW